MKRTLLLIYWFVLGLYGFSQDKYTLSGYIQDASNGEELIGVTIYNDSLKTGAVTNVYGFYSFTLTKGQYKISFSYVGYETTEESINLDQDISLNIKLNPSVTEIDEVVISGEAIDENVTGMSMSKIELDIGQIKKLPTFLGETDIIKTVQMLPGVVTAGEGTSTFFVRGGSADQNLILIDEAPVYDPSHLFGLFSVFNADVIKDSELYKGGIPSRYGGRLSSILDVRTKDGNNQKLSGSAGIGTLSSRAMLEAPIKKDVASIILSARRSYVDIFLKAAGEDSRVHFYDVNAKINWRKNNNNRLFAAVYLGRDVFKFSDQFKFGWGNKTTTFRWNHLFSEKLFSNTSLILSNFDYTLGLTDPVQGFDWTSDIKESSLKQDFAWYINPDNYFEFGFQSTYRQFSPGEITPVQENESFVGLKQDEMYALDHGIYLDIQNKISKKLDIRYGARLSIFQNIGEGTVQLYANSNNVVDPQPTELLEFGPFETIKYYIGLEPRFSMRYLLNNSSSVKISYNRLYQNTHLIASGTVPLPFNTWQPSGYYLKPQRSDQVAAGYFRNFLENQLEGSVEAYYKFMDNVTDFADNAQLFFNPDLPTEFRQGKSWSYGFEFMLEKSIGKWTGFTSYTWSKTTREVPDVNFGREFPANYDRRHSFNLVSTYDYNDKWSFGGSFTYGSGRPTTIPSAQYQMEGYYLPDYITLRNGYRMPDFHRMDLSATLNPRKNAERKFKSKWIFSLYNVYSRKNPFSIYTQQQEDSEGEPIPNKKEARMIYLFPILPSVTYNINF